MGLKNILMKIQLIRLKKRGLTVGENCKIYNTYFDYGHCFLIEIGNNVTISNSTILAHDASTKEYLGKTKVGKVIIKDRVFIGWGSVILPNVTIGSDVIIGAGSVINKDVPNGSVVGGVPARVIGKTSEFIEKNNKFLEEYPSYSTPWKNKSKKEMIEMKKNLNKTFGYDE